MPTGLWISKTLGSASECVSCHSNFEVPGTGGGVVVGQYFTFAKVPTERKAEVKMLNSRRFQKSFFEEDLELLIGKLKKQEREARRVIRRLAKLR